MRRPPAGARRGRARFAFGALLAILGLAALALPQSAAAHAVLVSATPERGTQVDAAPERVTLRFNEPVEAGFSAVRVFDAEAERVDEGDLMRPGGDSDAVGVALSGDLPDGSYTATFRVVSADSHPVSGGFVLTVGEGGAAPAASVAELIEAGDAGPATSVAFGAVRSLAYLSIGLAVGGVIFLGAVWLPGLRSASGARPEWADASHALAHRFGRLAVATVALGVATTALGVVLQGANAAGTSLWSALDPTVIGDVLGTRFGTIWGLRLLDWLLLGALALRFSPLALASVAALLATGTYQSILYLESLGDLTGSAFGRAILVKAALILVLIGLGALNLRRNRADLERLAAEGAPPGGAGRLLRRAVQAELALIAVVLAVTAALTSHPPPGAEAAGPFSASTELGPARLDVTVDPASSGANEIHLYLFHARDGSQWDRAKELTLQLRLPSRDIGPLEPRLDEAGPGHYVARRALIAPGGEWRLQVAARVSDFAEHRAVIEVPVE